MSGTKKPLDKKVIKAYLTQLEDSWLSEDSLDHKDSDDMQDAGELRRYLEKENDEDNGVEETVVADMVDEALDTDPPLVQKLKRNLRVYTKQNNARV